MNIPLRQIAVDSATTEGERHSNESTSLKLTRQLYGHVYRRWEAWSQPVEHMELKSEVQLTSPQ